MIDRSCHRGPETWVGERRHNEGCQRRVLFVRSIPLDLDSRATRMIDDYRRRGFAVVKLFWSRGAEIPAEKDSIIFSHPGRYGARFGNLINQVYWQAFIARTLIKLRKEVDIIHCVDLDCALVAVSIGRLLRRIVIFDSGDHFASKLAPGSLFRGLLAGLERLLLAKAHVAVLPDRIRLVQYGVREHEHLCFIANTPEDDGADEVPIYKEAANNQPLTLVYIGSLEANNRGLEYIPRLCLEHPDKVRFIVAGFGELTDYFRQHAATLPNLRYLGPQKYDASLRLMREADCLYGPYLLNVEAHRFAAPNKMYEHLMVGRPFLTNSGTPPGDFVAANGTGYVFDGSFAGLTRLVASLSKQGCADRGAIARRLWVERFRFLRQRQVQSYFSRLHSLLSSRVPARGA